MNVSEAVDVGYSHSNDFLNGFGMDLIIQNGGIGRRKTSTRSGRTWLQEGERYVYVTVNERKSVYVSFYAKFGFYISRQHTSKRLPMNFGLERSLGALG